MPNHPTKEDILALETEYWNALRRKDGTTAAQLSCDPCLVSGKQGVSAIGQAQMKTMTEDAKWSLDDYRFDEANLVSPAPDVAVLAYTVTQTVTMNGKTETRRAADCSTWIRSGAGWQCCAHSECFLD